MEMMKGKFTCKNGPVGGPAGRAGGKEAREGGGGGMLAPGEESGGRSLGPENEGHKSRRTRSEGRTPGKRLEGSTRPAVQGKADRAGLRLPSLDGPAFKVGPWLDVGTWISGRFPPS